MLCTVMCVWQVSARPVLQTFVCVCVRMCVCPAGSGIGMSHPAATRCVW